MKTEVLPKINMKKMNMYTKIQSMDNHMKMLSLSIDMPTNQIISLIRSLSPEALAALIRASKMDN